jgi:Cu(I)/Ag(I) efflux system membrane fusion protein
MLMPSARGGMIRRFRMVLAASFACALASACGDQPTGSKPVAPSASAPVAASPEATTALKAVLAAYERVRAALADDVIPDGPGGAGAIEAAATAAVAIAPAPLGVALRDTATAAAALKTMGATDANAVRKAFGEVSRGVVALASAAPALQSGLYMFECPMAQGYGRWVQPMAEMANPYMGKAMLQCGSPRKW